MVSSVLAATLLAFPNDLPVFHCQQQAQAAALTMGPDGVHIQGLDLVAAGRPGVLRARGRCRDIEVQRALQILCRSIRQVLWLDVPAGQAACVSCVQAWAACCSAHLGLLHMHGAR